ncbi:hypothetical protein FGSG_02665 [Fusarium graminearum PH-1]|uniref:Uncharacterized protein n=1 Tax=Gibberella zeae (strain ATCC MYA-4620 / CBS 123657 / FGSC 9075 / NRRL 31084 / PH-1) TaxID=229533 RepID=I1RG16_GIBZE|nr:hypothetical protein FGSG_02665 [Fusarium graminearum PH-1]ESU08130.1 hypothetical protein FGSG_02665 [Fusarium graminearum PH-1]EYB31956.1 hypothetical protein FG05_02665 [Fusarium graminearum]|eukprot:XP_011318615.1 hypothetical protein FGSG_02665 [Fusarium graminearum PH-1]
MSPTVDYTLPDPSLTKDGEAQCAKLRENLIDTFTKDVSNPDDIAIVIPSVSKDFPQVNFSTVDPVWPDKKSSAGRHYAHTKQSILARGKRALEDLHKRPEKLIFVVSHAGFLRLGVVGYWFYNSDYRVFDFETERNADGGLRVVQQKRTLTGGLGLSWEDPVALGGDLPEEDPETDPSAF